MAVEYGTVSIHAGSLGTLTAKPIIYGLTIPASAPNAALGEKFISFVLSSQGQAIMRSNGFTVISPALANPQGKVPASIKSAVAAQFTKLKAGQIKGIPTTVK